MREAIFSDPHRFSQVRERKDRTENQSKKERSTAAVLDIVDIAFVVAVVAGKEKAAVQIQAWRN